MAESTFPWSPQETEVSNFTERSTTKGRFEVLRGKLKPLLPFSIFFLVLVFLFIFRAQPSAESGSRVPSTDVLITMLALPKGSPIEAGTLRLVSFDKRALSKKQLLTLVLSQDVEALKGKIRTKKDVPPNQILFWDDVELLRGPSKHEGTKIFFPAEGT